MKKILFVAVAFLLLFGQPGHAGLLQNYNYVAPDERRQWLNRSAHLLIVDIQESKDFAAHHIKGSIETNGYPVKSDQDRQKIDPAIRLYETDSGYDAVVVVCPRGKGGAKRTYEYLQKKGVPDEKLFILTGGMGGWPYKEWVEGR